MTEHTLTLLHLSDLHERAAERSSWQQRPVLGQAWEANLDSLCEDGPYDLVCFTGDAAFAGQAQEYAKATEFFQAVLERLGLDWDRFFTIPGNHDIDRKIARPAWRGLREKLPRASRPEVAAWLAGGRTPLGFRDQEREQILKRQAAYRRWVREDLGRPDLDPANSAHGLLGYRRTLRLPGKPFALHVLGLDSAWSCGDDHDAGKIWLTEEQVMRLATDPKGKLLDGFRLVLTHHPLDDLADGAEVRRLLAERVDLMLRGHLHQVEAQTWADPERTLRQVVAGGLYRHDRYPNTCERIRLVLDQDGRPLRYEMRFRSWSERGHWFDDNGLYPETVDGRLTLWMKGKAEAPMADSWPALGSAEESPEQPKVGRPLMMEASPSITRTTHVLPFLRLSPADFERLCLALIHREGYERPEHLGAAGRDNGQDIVAYRNGRRVVFQCKRYEKLGPRAAEAVVSEILSLPEYARPEELILIATCFVSSEARKRARVKAGGIDFQVWALTELDALVQKHPDLLSQFFDLRDAGDLDVRGQRSKQTKRFVGIDPERPEPSYPDEATRVLAEALKAAYRHKKEVAVAGGDTQIVDKQILDLRRQLREGGRLKPGDCLAEGRYLLSEALGRGGFATVWRAYDENDHRLVAVKVLHGQFAEDRTRLERFFRGARKMGELNHPGIVRVLESRLDEGGYHFFVMEYVAGGDLRQAVLEQRVGPEEALHLLREVSIALQFAHEKGFIHRDVKPANILLDTGGRPKLTDFDLVLGSDTTGGTLMGAGMMGTFLYSAPEVMSEPSEATAAADVYSLAMTAAFCLFGKDLPIDVLRDTEAFLRRLSCSSRTRAAIKKAIALQPEERFSSVVEFAEALDPVSQSSSTIDELKEEPLDRSAKIDYQDFYIRIQPDSTGGYLAFLESPYGSATSPFKLPFSRSRLRKVPEEFAKFGSDKNRPPEGAFSPEAIGQALFNSLFVGDLGRLFYESLASLEHQRNRGLRIRLAFDLRAPSLIPVAALPWELLWDPKRKDFLSRIRQTPVVRYLDVSRPPLSPLIGPLRILFVQSSPKNLPALDLAAEWKAIWKSLGSHPEIMISAMQHPTIGDLRSKLLEEPWHVVHFMGHGGFDDESGEGSIFFEASNGEAQSISGRLLGEHLKSIPDLRLVFINACKGGIVPRIRGQDPYSGTAAALVQAGVPAVVAMQGLISDSAAIAFSANFYARIAAGDPVDAAAVEGRLAILREESLDWATPVLFTRVPDGDILGRHHKRIIKQQERIAQEVEPMERGNIVTHEGQQVTVQFSRGHERGRVRPEAIDDFRVLLQIFAGDDTVQLASLSGDWKAEVHIWEPDNLEPRLGSFRYTIQGVPTTSSG